MVEWNDRASADESPNKIALIITQSFEGKPAVFFLSAQQ